MPSYTLEVQIIICPSRVCYCVLHETVEMQTGICLTAYKGGYAV